ncbi:hypothetical protein QVD17_11149 [Tagetes erecta]|uniref:Uncharacterized protein n=1 Tax=Tagetes erecta TaxID=13708 RepID=A0AAD8LAQ4_TARER|nr:hypothetical protein QVD17_11149 [Tagetes erecta]
MKNEAYKFPPPINAVLLRFHLSITIFAQVFSSKKLFANVFALFNSVVVSFTGHTNFLFLSSNLMQPPQLRFK